MKRITECGAMDVCAWGGYLFVLEEGRLAVYRNGVKAGECTGLGQVRQVRVSETGLVCVTAREDGLWCIGVKDGKPQILSRFRTVEYATGLCVCGKIAFVSCRQYGVEKVDLSDPEKPRHLGLIRMGEAQSCTAAGGVLFGGIWGGMRVDAADPADGERLYSVPLSGRGDGIAVAGGRLFASTGQHRRGIRDVTDEKDPCFGMGNGVECHDLTQSPPSLLWRTEFGKDYTRSCDTWRPVVAGDVIACGCSSLGVYLVKAENGEILAHYPVEEGNPVTGIAADGETLFIATKRDGVFAASLRGDMAADPCGSLGGAIPAKPPVCEGIAMQTLWRAAGTSVTDIAEWGEGLAAACVSSLRLIGRDGKDAGILPLPEGGEALAVAAAGGILGAACGNAGLVLYGADGKMRGRYACSLPVQQICLSAHGLFALIGCGSTQMRLLDLRDPAKPVCLDILKNRVGPLYGSNFARHRLKDGTMLGFWHRDGLFYTNPESGDRKIRLLFYPTRHGFLGFGPENGIDTDGETVFYDLAGGLVPLPFAADYYPDEAEAQTSSIPLKGKITVFGDLIVCTERDRGRVSLFCKTEGALLPLGHADLSGSPGLPVTVGGEVFLPCGYDGLIRVTPCP